MYGSINIAQINDGAITPEHADYLRKKYLFRDNSENENDEQRFVDEHDPKVSQ